MNRKEFLTGLGAAAAACVARPAAAATARIGASDKARVLTAADLPMKTRPAARIVVQRSLGA
jgi:hypothetical protein